MDTRIQKNIKALRKTSGLSAREISSRIGKSSTTVGGYERGISSPPLNVIYQLAEIFKVSAAALISEDLTDPEAYKRATSGQYSYTDTDNKEQIVREKQLLYNALTEEEGRRAELEEKLESLKAELRKISPKHPKYDDFQELLKMLEP